MLRVRASSGDVAAVTVEITRIFGRAAAESPTCGCHFAPDTSGCSLPSLYRPRKPVPSVHYAIITSTKGPCILISGLTNRATHTSDTVERRCRCSTSPRHGHLTSKNTAESESKTLHSSCIHSSAMSRGSREPLPPVPPPVPKVSHAIVTTLPRERRLPAAGALNQKTR